MNWKIIVEKMVKNKLVVKEGIIKVQLSSIEAVLEKFKAYGWKCTYAVPVTDLETDEDTLHIELGGAS
jgi:hypothetical protein